ncbi:ITFG1 [Mytilus coruscus]|uniref:ITFG1 n=1 Tax=Mytilus coruscus TaxID=42192 RepID=A0A6J8AAW9_MYTCO|nr:ITFG1 [Mytilus coruscus]
MCRDLMCIPGKVFANNTCIPLLQMTEDLCYVFAVHFDAVISENAQDVVGIDLIRELADEAFDDLITRLTNTSIYDNMKYKIANVPCSNIQTSFSGYLYFDICTSGIVSRLYIDSNLLHLMNLIVTLNQGGLIMTVKYESGAEAYDVPSLVDNIAVANLCTYQSVTPIRRGKLAMYYRVNELLLCTPIEFTTHEYEKQRNRVIKLQNSGHLLGSNDYLTVKNDHIRVCSYRYLQLISEKSNKHVELPMFITRAICNVLSLICLTLTFMTYILFV